MPGEWFADGHERIFILRGGQGTGDGDGAGWTQDTTSNQLAIYDVVTENWDTETLPFAVGDGSEMALVGDTLFILASNTVSTNPLRSFRFSTVVRPPEPRNAGIQPLSGGGVRFHWQGNPGQAYVLETSNDLLNWTLSTVSTADTNGAINFDHSNASVPSRKFYRISP